VPQSEIESIDNDEKLDEAAGCNDHLDRLLHAVRNPSEDHELHGEHDLHHASQEVYFENAAEALAYFFEAIPAVTGLPPEIAVRARQATVWVLVVSESEVAKAKRADKKGYHVGSFVVIVVLDIDCRLTHICLA
jgi:hypothetical protein